MRGPSLKRITGWRAAKNKVAVFQTQADKNTDNSSSVVHKASWAYGANELPFANDKLFWSDMSGVVLSKVSSMRLQDYLSENCQKIREFIQKARDKSNALTEAARVDLFEKSKLCSKQIASLGSGEGIKILEDICANGLKVGSKKLCSTDKSELLFWQSVERKLKYAEGFKADTTNSPNTPADARTATFIFMSSKVNNRKVSDVVDIASLFKENFDSVAQGGEISDSVAALYREGLIRHLTGHTDDYSTE